MILDELIEIHNRMVKIDEELIERAKRRVQELNARIRYEENEFNRARIEDEVRTILRMLKRISVFRLGKIVRSALHESLFNERIIDPAELLNFESELYFSLVEQFKSYLKRFEVNGHE